MISFFPSRTVALLLFGWPIHWYGLLYLAAFAVAWYLLPRLQHYRGLSLAREQWDRILSWSVAGVILGGRIGYVLLYRFEYYVEHPLQVFAVWNGGMSSHGGFIGVAIALWIVLRHERSSWLAIADVITVPVAIGLALGRVGNFINQELYGTVTTLPWAMSFPGADGLRHPTQLYAVAKDVFIAAVCLWHLRHRVTPGRTIALFLMIYGVLRFSLEFLRVQDGTMVDLGVFALSRGQLFTIPLCLIGLLLWVRTRAKES